MAKSSHASLATTHGSGRQQVVPLTDPPREGARGAPATNIEPDGAGDNMAPGTCKRQQDCVAEGRAGQNAIRDVFDGWWA